MEHEWMDWGIQAIHGIATGASSPGALPNMQRTLHREIRAKRRFSDTQAVCLVASFHAQAGTDTASFTTGYRTFCRIAKP